MDMTIQVEGEKIVTTIYAKPLALYQYMLEERPVSSWSLLLIARNHTWYLALHNGHFGPYHGPKNKNKDSSHCRLLF
jgi:hypothetical protein